MRAARQLAVLLLLLAGSASVRAEEPALRTGETVELRLGGLPRGIEPSIPRGGAYERGLAAVRARRFRQASDLLLASLGELDRAAQDGRIPHRRARTLMLKAYQAAEHASTLGRAEKAGTGYEVRAAQALQWHDFYLALSAYDGAEDRALFERAASTYQSAMSLAGERWPRSRVAYAALLAAAGRRHEAAAEYLRTLSEPTPAQNIDYEVHYRAAMGDVDRAFAALRQLRDEHPSWAEERARLRAANDLDVLRDDPRFVRILGLDE